MSVAMNRPNIIFIMSDDHAAHAMSCYGSRINRTPHLDRIADECLEMCAIAYSLILSDGDKAMLRRALH